MIRESVGSRCWCACPSVSRDMRPGDLTDGVDCTSVPLCGAGNFGALRKLRCTWRTSERLSTIFKCENGRQVHRSLKSAPKFPRYTEDCWGAPKFPAPRGWRAVEALSRRSARPHVNALSPSREMPARSPRLPQVKVCPHGALRCCHRRAPLRRMRQMSGKAPVSRAACWGCGAQVPLRYGGGVCPSCGARLRTIDYDAAAVDIVSARVENKECLMSFARSKAACRLVGAKRSYPISRRFSMPSTRMRMAQRRRPIGVCEKCTPVRLGLLVHPGGLIERARSMGKAVASGGDHRAVRAMTSWSV